MCRQLSRIVRLSPDGRVRLNVRLIRLPEGHAVWTRTYEREAPKFSLFRLTLPEA